MYKIVIFIFSLSFFLRVFFIEYNPLTIDEINTWHTLFDKEKLKDLFNYLTKHETQMPLFYFVNHVVGMKFVFADWALRLQALVFTTLTLFFYHVNIKKLFNEKVAMYASLFLGFSFITLNYSIRFRPYYLLLIFSLLSTVYFYKLIQEKMTKRDFAFFALFLIGNILTHYYGILYSISLLLIAAIVSKYRKIILTIFGAILLVLLPFAADIIHDFFTHHNYRYSPDLFIIASSIAFLLSGKYVITFIAGLFSLHILKNRQNFVLQWKRELGTGVIVVLLCYGVSIAKSILSAPAFEARYFIILTPVIYTSIAILLSQIKIHKSQNIVMPFVLICLLTLFSKDMFKNYSLHTKVDYKKQYALAKDQFSAKQGYILLLNQQEACPYVYYLRSFSKDQVRCVWKYDLVHELVDELQWERKDIFIQDKSGIKLLLPKINK